MKKFSVEAVVLGLLGGGLALMALGPAVVMIAASWFPQLGLGVPKAVAMTPLLLGLGLMICGITFGVTHRVTFKRRSG